MVAPGTPVGVGIDLIDLAHFQIHYGDDDPELLARCFTEGELMAAGDGSDRLAKLAARFAAKEATIKALGGGVSVAFTDIEVVGDRTGAPSIALYGAAQEIAKEKSVGAMLLSLTHSAGGAAAVVIAISAGPM